MAGGEVSTEELKRETGFSSMTSGKVSTEELKKDEFLIHDKWASISRRTKERRVSHSWQVGKYQPKN